MARREQVLHIDPTETLSFKGPFTDVVTAELKLTNPSKQKIAFKVKTTAPRRYCVRPNSGILDESKNITVQVMLQPFEYDPAEKNRHKFMVQTMVVPDGQADRNGQVDQSNLWAGADPGALMDTKLKCVFEQPADGYQPAGQNNLDSNTADTPPLASTNESAPVPVGFPASTAAPTPGPTVTPSTASSTRVSAIPPSYESSISSSGSVASSASAGATRSGEANSDSAGSIKEAPATKQTLLRLSSSPTAKAAPVREAAAAPSAAEPTQVRSLQQENEQLKREIGRLQSEGLRHRPTQSGAESSSAAGQSAVTQARPNSQPAAKQSSSFLIMLILALIATFIAVAIYQLGLL